MKTDNLFYRIFSTLPTLALELAGVTVANPAGYGFRAEEVKQTAFRLDGLLVPVSYTHLTLPTSDLV